MVDFSKATVDQISVGGSANSPNIYSIFVDATAISDYALSDATIGNDGIFLRDDYGILPNDFFFFSWRLTSGTTVTAGPTTLVCINQTSTAFAYSFFGCTQTVAPDTTLPFYSASDTDTFDESKAGALNKLSNITSSVAVYTLDSTQRVDEIIKEPASGTANAFYPYLRRHGVQSGDVIFIRGTTDEVSSVAGAPYAIPVAVYQVNSSNVIQAGNNINKVAWVTSTAMMMTEDGTTFKDQTITPLNRPSSGINPCDLYSTRILKDSLGFKAQTRNDFRSDMTDLGSGADFGDVFLVSRVDSATSSVNTNHVLAAAPTTASNTALTFLGATPTSTQPTGLVTS